MTVRRRAEQGKIRLYTQKGDKQKKVPGIATITEVTFNFLNLIYDGMKEENLIFKNL